MWRARQHQAAVEGLQLSVKRFEGVVYSDRVSNRLYKGHVEVKGESSCNQVEVLPAHAIRLGGEKVFHWGYGRMTTVLQAGAGTLDRVDGCGLQHSVERVPKGKRVDGGFRAVTFDNEAAEANGWRGGFGSRLDSGAVGEVVLACDHPKVVAGKVGGAGNPVDRDRGGGGWFPSLAPPLGKLDSCFQAGDGQRRSSWRGPIHTAAAVGRLHGPVMGGGLGWRGSFPASK